MAHLFLEGKMLSLGVRDGLPFAGKGVTALSGLGSALGTLEVDGIHDVSLRQSGFGVVESKFCAAG